MMKRGFKRRAAADRGVMGRRVRKGGRGDGGAERDAKVIGEVLH